MIQSSDIETTPYIVGFDIPEASHQTYGHVRFLCNKERKTNSLRCDKESSVHDAMKIDFHILTAPVRCYIIV